MHEVRSGKLQRNFKVPRAGKIVRYNRGTLKVACVASVSVRFRNKERGTKVKDRAKNGASKRAGRGWGGVGKKGRKIPSPPLPLSFIFWLSFHFSRGQNRKSRSSSFFAFFLCSTSRIGGGGRRSELEAEYLRDTYVTALYYHIL